MRFYRIAIVQHLLKNDTTVIERAIYDHCKSNGIMCLQYDPDDERFRDSKNIPTLFIAIGGDGTMLYTVKESIKFKDATVLGISGGNLNFLTDQYTPEEAIDMIERIRRDDPDLFLDARTLVKATYHANSNPHLPYEEVAYALNEITVAPSSLSAMLRYTIDINGKPLASQGGSGVLVATATGSTAMAMSSGGAIVSPTSIGLQIVPIASHSLSSRPVVVSNHDTITIKAPTTDRITNVELLVDGQAVYNFNRQNAEFTVTITAAERQALIWRPDDWNFFDVLRDKMGWDT